MKRWLSALIGAALASIVLLSTSTAGVLPAIFTVASTGSVNYQSPAYVQGNTVQGTGTAISTQTVPYNSTQNAGDLNVVAINYNSASVTVSSVVDSSGNSYSAASSVITQSSFTQVIYYAPNIAGAVGGANTITVTLSSTAAFFSLRAVEYSGILATSPLDAIPSGGGTAGSTGTALTSGNLTTTQPDLIVAGVLVQNAVSGPGASYTTRVTTSGGNTIQDANVTTAGTYAATATQNLSGFWIVNAVAFKAAPTVPTFQTPAYVQGNTTQGGAGFLTTVSVTYTSAQRGNDLNVIAIGYSSASTIVSVSDTAGNSYAVASPLVTVSLHSAALYYAQNITPATAGANTVTVVISGGGGTFFDVTAAEYSGIATSGALDQANGAGSASATSLSSGNVTTTQANELLVGSNYVNGTTTAGGAGYIIRTPSTNNILEDLNVTSIGTYAATSVQTPAGPGVQLIATFKAGTGITPPSTFGVKASGNNLVSTQTGANVVLIGTLASGIETFVGAPTRMTIWANQSQNFWATTWKAQPPGYNTVRVHLNTQLYLGGTTLSGTFSGSSCTSLAGGDNSAAYQTGLAQMVQRATAAGVYVILDILADAPTGQCAIGEPGFLSANATTMWQKLAQQFGGNPAVIFDLFNEPYGADQNGVAACGPSNSSYSKGFGSGNCGNPTNPTIGPSSVTLANGGTFSPLWIQNNANGNAATNLGISYTSVGQLSLLATVRAAGATNLVLLSPWWFAGEIELWPQTFNIAAGNPDPLHNVAASMHAYGYNPSGNFSALTAVLNAGYPLLVTEFFSGQGLGLGDSIGNIGTGNSLISLGIDGLVACGANSWNGSSISFSSSSCPGWYRGHAGDGHTMPWIDTGVGAANDDHYDRPKRSGWRR